MNQSILDSEKLHLAELLEAVQRCVYFLDASSQNLTWPLTKQRLQIRKKDVAIFEAMAAINERFAKLQVTLGAAMRHACILAAHDYDKYLVFPKTGSVEIALKRADSLGRHSLHL